MGEGDELTVRQEDGGLFAVDAACWRVDGKAGGHGEVLATVRAGQGEGKVHGTLRQGPTCQVIAAWALQDVLAALHVQATQGAVQQGALCGLVLHPALALEFDVPDLQVFGQWVPRVRIPNVLLHPRQQSLRPLPRDGQLPGAEHLPTLVD